eukprot:TRINITY_DN4033_c0_g1_i1.p1 TRINITY_DN4033_c0_g1~~TRINITY_DN4033_c0_g1_i1.p1  ORF type:complete len:478 (-),score=38.36 TRINITY_DN4033_c0_g1_i1:187-1620(-)
MELEQRPEKKLRKCSPNSSIESNCGLEVSAGRDTPLLDWLPSELLLALLSFVDIGDLGRLACVCTALRDAVVSDNLWRDGLERIIGASADHVEKPDGQPWRECCRLYTSVPKYADLSTTSSRKFVMCPNRLGPYFIQRKNARPGLYFTPAASEDDAIAVTRWGVWQSMGSLVAAAPQLDRTGFAQLFDAQLKSVGQLPSAAAWSTLTFGSRLVRAAKRRLELLSMDSQVLASFRFPVEKRGFDVCSEVAVSSDRVGVLMCPTHWGSMRSQRPHEVPVKLLLFNSQLQLVDEVPVLTADDVDNGLDAGWDDDEYDDDEPVLGCSGFSSWVVCVAEQFLVITHTRHKYGRSFSSRPAFNAAFSVRSVSQGTSRTLPLRDVHGFVHDIDRVCSLGRLLVGASDFRTFCFSASGVLLWTFDIARHLRGILPRNSFLSEMLLDQTAVMIRLNDFGCVRLTVDECPVDSTPNLNWTRLPSPLP